jgi:hypothetical protein
MLHTRPHGYGLEWADIAFFVHVPRIRSPQKVLQKSTNRQRSAQLDRHSLTKSSRASCTIWLVLVPRSKMELLTFSTCSAAAFSLGRRVSVVCDRAHQLRRTLQQCTFRTLTLWLQFAHSIATTRFRAHLRKACIRADITSQQNSQHHNTSSANTNNDYTQQQGAQCDLDAREVDLRELPDVIARANFRESDNLLIARVYYYSRY